MDVTKLLNIAAQFPDVPEIIEAGATVALDVAVLIDRIRDNHARAQHVLAAGVPAELDAVHAGTLAAIDAFDAELAKAATR